MTHVASNLSRAFQSFSSAAARPAKKRKGKKLILSAACRKGIHARCFSRNCTCGCGICPGIGRAAA